MINLSNVVLNVPLIASQSKKVDMNNFNNKIDFTGSRPAVKVLQNINLIVNEGEKIGLFGKNGSGKTSLLKVISGIYKPTHGSVEVSGRIISFLDLMAGMDFEFSGRDNSIMRGLLYGLTSKEIKKKIPDIKKYSGLNEFFDLPMKTYSTGMQMRLAFAVAMHVNGDIIVMDEWLSVGDKNFQEQAENSLTKLVDKSRILVIASHSYGMLERLCNRIIRLDEGNIINETNVDKNN